MADTVHRALCPRVAVLSGADVDAVAQRNGAQDFAQLMRPFEQSIESITVHTSQLEQRKHASFPLRFDPLHAFMASDERFVRGSLDFFLDTVQTHLRTHGQQLDLTQPVASLEPGEDRAAWDAQVRTTPPWCNDIASYLYRYRPISAFATFSHPLALMLVVSASNPDPMNAFAQLYDASRTSDIFRTQPHLESDLLRTYVVVHDTADPCADRARSEALLDEVQKTYGLQCALLVLNSSQAPDAAIAAQLRREWDTPDLRSPPPPTSTEVCALSNDDVARIHAFLREFVVRSLVPYMERSVQQLNEQVGSSRRGLTGRLLGAGRKWFGTRAPADQAPTTGYDRERRTYPASTLAAQTRRLADLAFHVQDYRLAAEMYDAVRRDYEQDHATSYVAAATEMLCLTRLLTPGGEAQAPALFTAACDAYLQDPAGRLYALRLTFLYSALQRERQQGAQVAVAFLRATSFTDEVLRGVVLELAALAFLCMPHPYVRKSAATMLQSAEQFDACGQKAFALRCYHLVAPYYERLPWPALSDYVRMKLVRHAQMRGANDDALSHLVQLLHPSQRTAQQDRELLDTVLAEYPLAAPGDALELPYPVWDVTESTIAHEHSAAWDAMLVEHELAHLQRHGVHEVGTNAAFWVQLHARNPLRIPLDVSDVVLTWSDEHGTPLDAAHVSLDAPPLRLDAEAQQVYSVPVRLGACGTFRLHSVAYVLAGRLPVRQTMHKRGARLHATKMQRTTPTYAPDTSLQVRVRAACPCVDIAVHDAPDAAYVGAALRLRVSLHNRGTAAARLARIVCTPMYCTLGAADAPATDDALVVDADAHPAPAHALDLSLAPDERTELVWTLPLVTSGPLCVQWLVVYHDEHNDAFTSYAQHSLVAHPLLDGAVSYKPAAGPSYLALLTLANQSHETVAINGVSMLSMQWHGTAYHGPTSLAPGEQATVAVRVARAATPADQTLPAAVAALAPLFGQQRPRPSLAPLQLVASALQGDGARWPRDSYIAAHASLRAQWVDETYPFLPHAVRRDAFLFTESNEVDFLVAWSLPHGGQGCTLLYGAQIGLRTDAPSDLATLDDLVRQPGAQRAMYEATAREQASRAHQLLASPLARVPEPVGVEIGVDTAPHDDRDIVQLQAKPVPLRSARRVPARRLGV
ncbi:hypothetical protein CBS9595_000950 [Malassezia furfur]|nr:hypothetical protein CBS9595_000950 [Malassezia furfur]